MQPVLTPAEMAAADRRAIAAGTPESVLVERAGGAVARHAIAMLGGTYGRRVVVVRGKGNNGADGLVAARRLRARGVGVDEFAITDNISVESLTRALARSHLVIDAMFGTGFRGGLEGNALIVARAIRGARTLAIDIPSGVDGTTGEVRGDAVRADATICFAALKPGLCFEPGRSLAGRVTVADIGIPTGVTHLHALDLVDLALPRRGISAHKWSAGVLVVGGSLGLIGAPLLASHAAARAGGTMVVCALPGADAAARASGGEIVTRALPSSADGALERDAADEIAKDIERFRALALGPGLGRAEGTQLAVRQLVGECPIPLVVDADALNALAVDHTPLRERVAAGKPPAIITPHAGEFARLAGVPVAADRVQAARDLAARTGAIVVLKGPGTVTAAPNGDAIVNRTDTPALGTAGTGDVLTGIIAGFLAGGAEPFAAAASAVAVHGMAARAAGTGNELVATDVVDALPRTLDALRAGHEPRLDPVEGMTS